VIVTGDAFVPQREEGRLAPKEFKADATEMEGAAVAHLLAAARAVPDLRSLSDSAGAKASENVLLFEKSAARMPRCSVTGIGGRLEGHEHSSRLLGRSALCGEWSRQAGEISLTPRIRKPPFHKF